MYDYKLLEAFAAVVDFKGFEKAAANLFITQSAVSQRVRQLEESLGQILLVRSNPPKPTEAGKKIIAHWGKVKLLESGLAEELSETGGSDYTTLSIGLNADTLATWFFDAVENAIRKHRILLDLHVDDQDETHRLMRDGEVAGCITTREKPFQSCTCTYIGSMTYRMYSASDIYDKFFPNGLSADALKDVPVIIYNEKDTLHLQMFEKAFGKTLINCPKMYIPSVEQYFDAVRRGFGIGMMPDNQCKDLLENGVLKDVFAPHVVKAPLYWHRWSISSSPMDALTKALINKPKLL
ncbi:MAG: transcriptional regulator ArgP [Denitrovibrio sp.]|nr:MAG: transcriptional regulator ArgP [Denitrovibrio sp.]